MIWRKTIFCRNDLQGDPEQNFTVITIQRQHGFHITEPKAQWGEQETTKMPHKG